MRVFLISSRITVILLVLFLTSIQADPSEAGISFFIITPFVFDNLNKQSSKCWIGAAVYVWRFVLMLHYQM